VPKDSLRIEICGDLDELNAYLGLSKNLAKGKKIKKVIESIQEELFIVGAEVATEIKFINKLKQRIGKACVKRLETMISQIEKKNHLSDFCLPGKDLTSGSLDVARTIARRLERRMVSLKKQKGLKNDFILIYFNRLSDLLFLLAVSLKKSPKRR